MATIQDIFDWLNQGAQGDIPGTGGEQPNAPQASQSAQPTPSAATPQQATPTDYAGDIPPTLLPHYDALVKSGVPPMVAHHIMTQPSVGEGDYVQQPGGFNPWPYPYAGAQQEYQSAQKTPPSYQRLWQQMQQKMDYDRMNLPTWEEHTPGDDDNLGFTRLPSGQYVPTPWVPAQQSGQKKSGLQADPGYQAGMQGGTGILDMLFGKQPSQTIGDWLSGDQ